MAIQASGRVQTTAINSQRALYHIRNFILGLNPAHITIVDSSAAGGSWDSEANVGDGAYLVLQSAYTVGGSRWQLFIGGRSTAGNLTPGMTGSYNGLYVDFSWDGSWSSAQGKFTGLRLYDLFGGPVKVDRAAAANMGPFNMEMAVVERLSATTGAVLDVAFIWIGDNLKDGTWDSGVYAGTIHPANSAVARPTVVLVGAPSASSTSNNWAYYNAGNANGGCLASDNATLNKMCGLPAVGTYEQTNWFLTDDGGGIYGEEYRVYNAAAQRVKGRLVEVYKCDYNLSTGLKTADGKWMVVSGLLVPSKP